MTERTKRTTESQTSTPDPLDRRTTRWRKDGRRFLRLHQTIELETCEWVWHKDGLLIFMPDAMVAAMNAAFDTADWSSEPTIILTFETRQPKEPPRPSEVLQWPDPVVNEKAVSA